MERFTVAALLATAAPLAHAGFCDRFNSPGATTANDANDPNDLGFHAVRFSPAPEIRQVEGRGGVMAISMASSGAAADRDLYAAESFDPVVLTMDSPVVLGFSMRATAQPSAQHPIFAFGLYDSKGTEVTDSSDDSYWKGFDDQGYHVYLQGSDTIRSSIESDLLPDRLDREGGFVFGPRNFADGQWHDYTLILNDLGNGTFLFAQLYIDGVITAALPVDRGVANFDTVHFGLVQGALDVELDDIYVSDRIVPPPGTLALLAIGSGLAARRRRSV